MKGRRYDFSKSSRVRQDVVPSSDAPIIIEQLTLELENQKLARAYEVASLAMAEFFEQTGRQPVEDVQF